MSQESLEYYIDIDNRCPCNAGCYGGCATCGGWQCEDAHLIDPKSPDQILPQGVKGDMKLDFSDEFNGDDGLFNTNKWKTVHKVQKSKDLEDR